MPKIQTIKILALLVCSRHGNVVLLVLLFFQECDLLLQVPNLLLLHRDLVLQLRHGCLFGLLSLVNSSNLRQAHLPILLALLSRLRHCGCLEHLGQLLPYVFALVWSQDCQQSLEILGNCDLRGDILILCTSAACSNRGRRQLVPKSRSSSPCLVPVTLVAVMWYVVLDVRILIQRK